MSKWVTVNIVKNPYKAQDEIEAAYVEKNFPDNIIDPFPYKFKPGDRALARVKDAGECWQNVKVIEVTRLDETTYQGWWVWEVKADWKALDGTRMDPRNFYPARDGDIKPYSTTMASLTSKNR
ncbi:hypothetical protein EW026_g2180 [Hermanssonia centrifuga]|uniref:Uncharacterized protein n=1 Tax=Hermanssonia centrifuga TaxID=98765 RepID=A0A4S4KP51_9APHY|nr:hypothetical protein EW026_g2180 [Hermanssonia centrifuga]